MVVVGMEVGRMVVVYSYWRWWILAKMAMVNSGGDSGEVIVVNG